MRQGPRFGTHGKVLRGESTRSRDFRTARRFHHRASRFHLRTDTLRLRFPVDGNPLPLLRVKPSPRKTSSPNSTVQRTSRCTPTRSRATRPKKTWNSTIVPEDAEPSHVRFSGKGRRGPSEISASAKHAVSEETKSLRKHSKEG
jgi:hypothetical protein